MTKIEAALAFVAAIDAMRATPGEEAAQRLLDGIDALLLLPETETEPTPPAAPSEGEPELYGWMMKP